jgi:30S ribosomal protein S31
MGRGDKRSAKGKRFKGSFGKSRPHKVKAAARPASAPKKEKAPKVEKAVAVKKAPAKKAAAKKKTEE